MAQNAPHWIGEARKQFAQWRGQLARHPGATLGRTGLAVLRSVSPLPYYAVRLAARSLQRAKQRPQQPRGSARR